MSQAPHERIRLPDGWWEQFVHLFQTRGFATLEKFCADTGRSAGAKPTLSPRTLYRAKNSKRKDGQITAKVFDILLIKLEFKTRGELLLALGNSALTATQEKAAGSSGHDQSLVLKDAVLVPVDINCITKYAPEDLIGREVETILLNDAWAKARNLEPKRPHILGLVALGGEGKTSLVAKWADDLADQHWRGCAAVFAWSFYHQGTNERTNDSSELFLAKALKFFGDAETAVSAQDASDKGKRLGQLVGERRVLLILDGVEPLQYPPTSPRRGELKDKGLAALLKSLATTNTHGLCVVTTRYAIADLRAYWQTTAPMHDLRRLSTAAGVKLLRKIGVKTGSQAEFEKLVEDVDGHALTLQIIGGFLVRAFRGDIRCRDRVRFEKADASQGGHAFQVMEAYVDWLEHDGEEARREVALLKLLGLFDRPATADCVNALRQAPAIPGLTGPLVGVEEDDWELSLTSLRDAKLLTVNRLGNSGELVTLDAHPLLREYFAQRLSRHQPKAWRAAHERLYNHLCETTPDEPLPTLEELQLLYQAVAHGCQAKRFNAAWKTFEDRIQKGTKFYSPRTHGTYGLCLETLRYFFTAPFDTITPLLKRPARAFVGSLCSVCLRALGRLDEALKTAKLGLSVAEEVKETKLAAFLSRDLGQSYFHRGDVDQAKQFSLKSIQLSQVLSDDPIEQYHCLSRHAEIMHAMANIAEAEAAYRKAEKAYLKAKPNARFLKGYPAFLYCDFLLDQGQFNDVKTRLAQSLQEPGLPRAVVEGLEELLRARLSEERQSNAHFLQDDLRHADRSMAKLRMASEEIQLMRGLLVRSRLRVLSNNCTGSESAKSDLDEAWEIAERGPMPLFLADIHLHRARLFHAMNPYPWKSPQGDLAEARRLIKRHSYLRRMEELEAAEAAAAHRSQTGHNTQGQ